MLASVNCSRSAWFSPLPATDNRLTLTFTCILNSFLMITGSYIDDVLSGQRQQDTRVLQRVCTESVSATFFSRLTWICYAPIFISPAVDTGGVTACVSLAL